MFMVVSSLVVFTRCLSTFPSLLPPPPLSLSLSLSLFPYLSRSLPLSLSRSLPLSLSLSLFHSLSLSLSILNFIFICYQMGHLAPKPPHCRRIAGIGGGGCLHLSIKRKRPILVWGGDRGFPIKSKLWVRHCFSRCGSRNVWRPFYLKNNSIRYSQRLRWIIIIVSLPFHVGELVRAWKGLEFAEEKCPPFFSLWSYLESQLGLMVRVHYRCNFPISSDDMLRFDIRYWETILWYFNMKSHSFNIMISEWDGQALQQVFSLLIPIEI